MKREYVMLAKEHDTQPVLGWLASIKFDGQRAFWDGGVSRRMPKVNVPWANTEKDGRYRSEQIATGLWSRHGHVIHAPDWWLDKLPKGMMLDGELWLGRGTFQELRTIVAPLKGVGWERVAFRLLDLPNERTFFQNGLIGDKWIIEDQCVEWYARHAKPVRLFDYVPTFSEVIRKWDVLRNEIIIPTEQRVVTDENQLIRWLDEEVSAGGEGLVVRNPTSVWVPHRSSSLLKVKPHRDAEGTVVGVISGQGKYLGMMGSLRIRWGDVFFQLSGFTDEERSLVDRDGWARKNAGMLCPPWVESKFPIGTQVRFRFREVTNEGLPKEARYWR